MPRPSGTHDFRWVRRIADANLLDYRRTNGRLKHTFALEYLPTWQDVAVLSRRFNRCGFRRWHRRQHYSLCAKPFVSAWSLRMQLQRDRIFAFENTLSERSYLKLVERLSSNRLGEWVDLSGFAQCRYVARCGGWAVLPTVGIISWSRFSPAFSAQSAQSVKWFLR